MHQIYIWPFTVTLSEAVGYGIFGFLSHKEAVFKIIGIYNTFNFNTVVVSNKLFPGNFLNTLIKGIVGLRFELMRVSERGWSRKSVAFPGLVPTCELRLSSS